MCEAVKPMKIKDRAAGHAPAPEFQGEPICLRTLRSNGQTMPGTLPYR